MPEKKARTWQSKFAGSETGGKTDWSQWFGKSVPRPGAGLGSLSADWRWRWRQYDEEPVRSDGSVNVRMMAKYLRELRRTVRIVFRNRHLTVDWSVEDSSSTDIAGGNIVISPYPLLDTSNKRGNWNLDQRLDVLHGIALHEASHNNETPADAMLRMNKLGGPLLAWLFNLVEDPHIEACVVRDFPGYGGYFDALCRWIFYEEKNSEWAEKLRDTDMRNVEKIVGLTEDERKALVMAQLDVIIGNLVGVIRSRFEIDLSEAEKSSTRHAQAVRLISECADIARQVEPAETVIENRFRAAELLFSKIVSFVQPSLEGKTTQEQGRGFLGANDETTLEELFQSAGVSMSQGEGSAEGRSGADKNELKETEHTKGKTTKIRLSREDASKVDGAIGADMREVDLSGEYGSERMEYGMRGQAPTKVHMITMRRMPYADERYNRLKRTFAAEKQRLRKVLEFRSEDYVYTERGRPVGKLDDSRLADLVGFKDSDVFKRTIRASAPDVHLGVLIDESGSMRGTVDYYGTFGPMKQDTAVGAAVMLAEALQLTKGVTYEFWGHTGDVRGYFNYGSIIESEREECQTPVPGVSFQGPLIMKYLDTEQGLTDPRVLGRIVGRSQNYDGLAIAAIAKEMVAKVPNRRKVMFVISDGMPSGYGYGGTEDTKRQIARARKQGVEIIGIYVGALEDAREQMTTMYGELGWDWVVCESAPDLPRALMKLSRRILHWDRRG